MNVELKLVSLELLSISGIEKPDSSRIAALVHEYDTNGRLWPLVLISPLQGCRRYRVRAEVSVIQAARAKQVEAVWCLIVPPGPLPYRFGAVYPTSGVMQEAANESRIKLLQKGEAFRRAIQSGLSQQQVARQFGVSRSYINNAVQMTKLSHTVRAAFLKGDLSPSQARVLSYENNEQRQKMLLAWIQREAVSVRKLEQAVYQKQTLHEETVHLKKVTEHLMQRWGCRVTLHSCGQGIRVVAQPHTDRLMEILTDLKPSSAISEVSWPKKKGYAAPILTGTFSSRNAFSEWLTELRLTDLDDLNFSIVDSVW